MSRKNGRYRGGKTPEGMVTITVYDMPRGITPDDVGVFLLSFNKMPVYHAINGFPYSVQKVDHGLEHLGAYQFFLAPGDYASSLRNPNGASPLTLRVVSDGTHTQVWSKSLSKLVEDALRIWAGEVVDHRVVTIGRYDANFRTTPLGVNPKSVSHPQRGKNDKSTSRREKLRLRRIRELEEFFDEQLAVDSPVDIKA